MRERSQGDVVAAVERAHETVVEAHEALDACRRDLLRLQQLSERLLSVGPPAIVVDAQRRVRGLSAAAEKLLGVSAPRVIGRPVVNMLPDIDLSFENGGGQHLTAKVGRLRARVQRVGDDQDADRLVLLELDPS